AQVKLLRVIQERHFLRLGSTVPRLANFRLICATHRDLEQRIREGLFREDLYYRIAVLRIDLPPLPQRREGIPLLAQGFLRGFSAKFGVERVSLAPRAIEELVAHQWPGNIRELEHTIERAVALSACGEEVGPGLIAPRASRQPFRLLIDACMQESRGLEELL